MTTTAILEDVAFAVLWTVVCAWWDTCTVYWQCVTVFGLPISRIIRQDKMDQLVAPTTTYLTPADLNWWEILQHVVCLACGGKWAYNTSLDFCTVLGVLGVKAEIQIRLTAFVNIVSVWKPLCWNILSECISIINYLPHLIFQCFSFYVMQSLWQNVLMEVLGLMT